MAIALDPKQIVLNDELLMSQGVSEEAIIRLLVKKGIFSKEEFLETVEVVNLKMRKMV
jgi:transketolase N-terminal domain/subunit